MRSSSGSQREYTWILKSSQYQAIERNLSPFCTPIWRNLGEAPSNTHSERSLIGTFHACHRRLVVRRSQEVKEYKHTRTQVSNKTVINKLQITRERVQFLVKLEVSGVQLLNMSSLKVLLKLIERRYQNSLFRSIYFKKMSSVATCFSFLITSVSYLTCVFSKLT